jgi:hypothetical protein
MALDRGNCLYKTLLATLAHRHERASRRTDLTDPGECGLQDCSVGGVAHCRQLPGEAHVSDHGLRTGRAAGQEGAGQRPGIPHVV